MSEQEFTFCEIRFCKESFWFSYFKEIVMDKSNKWKNKLKEDPVPWLLSSNPWTKYKTLTDLMELPLSSPEFKEAKNELVNDVQVKNLISETSKWFEKSFTRHNDPKIPHYKLMMLAELGLNEKNEKNENNEIDENDEGIKEIIQKATEHIENDMFAIRQELPEKSKGFAKPNPDLDEWHALPCDSPILTNSLCNIEKSQSVSSNKS